MQRLKGIRQRGNTFQFNVSVNGQRVTGSALSLAEAIKERDSIKQALKEGKTCQNVPTENPESKPAAKTLKAVFDLTHRSRWSGTKGEKTAIINGQAALNYFGERAHVTDINARRIQEYADFLKDRNKESTINRKLSALSTMLRTAEEYEIIERSPVIRRKREYGGRDRYVSREEERQMLAILEHWGLTDFRDAIIFLIDTGARCGELLKLTKEDVDFSMGKYGVVSFCITKSDKPRGVPLTERASAVMKARVRHLENGDRIFPYTPNWIRNNWDRMKDHMGLSDDPQFVPHILRHTYASRLVQCGTPITKVQAALGHASLQTTMRYSHLSPTSLFDIVDGLEKV